MKATVDIERCFGCEYCASTCPTVFKMKHISDDEEKSFAIDGEIPDDVLDLALDIETTCPAAAIIIED